MNRWRLGRNVSWAISAYCPSVRPKGPRSNTWIIWETAAPPRPCGSLPREPPTGYPNRYRSNNLINRITVVTNNRNNTGIVTNGVYIWYASRHQQKYILFFLRSKIQIEYLHRSPASCKRWVIRDDVKGTQCPGVEQDTLFLGDINTGTWPSRLVESQIFLNSLLAIRITLDSIS
jgi:hypothetical protein